MRRLVMWLVAVGVSASLMGCTCPMGGGSSADKKAPAKATTAAKAAVKTADKAATK